MILFDFKSPQAQTGPNGGPPEKLSNPFLPRQSASWPWCMGRSKATRSHAKNNILLQKHAGTEKRTT